jgi:hypothetical protein
MCITDEVASVLALSVLPASVVLPASPLVGGVHE